VIRLGALIWFTCAFTFAESWSGTLVDSRCYASEEHNVNPTDTMTWVDRDMNLEIRYCSPNAKTKSFVIVQADGLSFRLDSAGNAKAAELVRNAGKKFRFVVAITGGVFGNKIRVDSISTPR